MPDLPIFLAASAGQRSSIRALLLRCPSTVPARRPLHACCRLRRAWGLPIPDITTTWAEVSAACPSSLVNLPHRGHLHLASLVDELAFVDRNAIIADSCPDDSITPRHGHFMLPNSTARPPRYSFSNAMQRLRRSLFPHYSTPSHPACVTRGGPEPPVQAGRMQPPADHWATGAADHGNFTATLHHVRAAQRR